jgi:hypothetical protein
MDPKQLLKVIGAVVALMIAVVGVLMLGVGALSKALNGKPSLDLGYDDPTIEDSSIWRFIGWTVLAAAGYLAFHVLIA